MRSFFEWINETGPSIALRESLVVWPILEATHVITILLFAGTILLVDLRLLNVAFAGTRPSELNRRVLPWTVGSLVVMIVTGLLLLYAKPMVYYESVFFRAKLLVIGFALVNVWVFHRFESGNGEAMADAGATPVPARVAAGVSLLSWVSVIVLGRMIAYDWYACPKLEPGSVLHVFAGCEAVEAVEVATLDALFLEGGVP